jgi:hypothetical protein
VFHQQHHYGQFKTTEFSDVSLANETWLADTPAATGRSTMWFSTPHVMGLTKPSGGDGDGEYAELIVSDRPARLGASYLQRLAAGRASCGGSRHTHR